MKCLKENLIDQGMKLINKEKTFFRYDDDYSSMLDIIMTNRTSKVKSVSQKNDSQSDHSVLTFNRQMKVIQSEELYIKTRKLSNLDTNELNSKIFSHELYYKSLYCNNPNEISDNIIQMVNDIYDEVAPMKKIKIDNNIKFSNNKYTKEAINQRDKAYKLMKRTNLPEDKVNFKNIKITTKRIIRQEKAKYEYKNFNSKICL